MTPQQSSFAIQGMYCARCAVTIEQVLMRLDGLVSATVNFATERATVTFDPTRIGMARMVDAVNDAGYSVPLEHITWYAGDLLYASTPAAVKKSLTRCSGVVRVSTNFASGQIMLEGFAGQMREAEIEERIHQLGLGSGSTSRGRVAAEFLVRALLAIVVAVVGLAVLYQSDPSVVVRDRPTAVLLAVLAAFGLFGAGWPYYRHSWAALRQRQFDSGIGIALFSTAILTASAAVTVNPVAQPAIMSLAWAGLVTATLLNAAWFIARGLWVWNLSSIHRAISGWTTPRQNMDAASEMIEPSVGAAQWRRQWLPPLTGMVGAAALLGLYLGILSIAQSPSHALEQLAQDQLWVGLVVLGFAIQIGLYVYLRLIVQALQLAGATALTGVGTGASTLGMIACCAHHVTDITPLVALTGASGLSGIVTFAAEWKIPFILLGLTVNAVGIVLTLRSIRTAREHLSMMSAAIAPSHGAVRACHG